MRWIEAKVGSPGTVTCTTSSLLAHASMTIIMAIDVGFYLHNMAICDMATATSSASDPNTQQHSDGLQSRQLAQSGRSEADLADRACGTAQS